MVKRRNDGYLKIQGRKRNLRPCLFFVVDFDGGGGLLVLRFLVIFLLLLWCAPLLWGIEPAVFCPFVRSFILVN